ncbi:serine hydrolase domain-containing protein [Actinosynnema sp. CS-041913]|uniref:serine hydrolase domain-containing protein n=1 Tax=Actinosynnema sp. CS-041913 TaxID=3239917 RepID=UPI003D8C1FB1
MRTSLLRIGGVVVATALLTGITVQGAVASSEQADAVHAEREPAGVRQAMDEMVAAGAAGVVVRVSDRRGEWAGSAGVAELRRSVKPSADGRFRVGSVTKSFVATVVLQLVGEGRVGLDDPVDRHLPRYGLDRRVTVRMLLQHTSGLFNYTGDVRPDGTSDPGIPMWGQDYVDNMFRTYRTDELVRFALAKPARFAPGARYSYSNTNYALLGLLIEKVTGTGYATQVERRIVKPLGLRGTSLPGTRTGIPGPHAHSYFGYRHGGELKVVDVTRMNPSWAGAAGEMISTTRDLDTFISALLGGRLLAPSLLAEMRKWVPTGDGNRIGLGLFQTEFGPGCTGQGHTGGTQSATTYMYSTADRGKRVEFSVTHGAMDSGDPAVRTKFNAAYQKLATVALCGTGR